MQKIKFISFLILIYCVGFKVKAENRNSEKFKAVLIVGHQEHGTNSAISSMNKVGDLLKKNNVITEKFYDKDAKWEKILDASKDANFFVYSGHGSNLGINGCTGGLCIESRVTSQEIIDELKLKENAIVIFKSVCGGAGSSASDNGDIGIDEAKTRVSDYSKPFFDIGAACYFANNSENGAIVLLEAIFAGKNAKECFIQSTKTMQSTTWSNGIKKVEYITSPGTKIEISEEYKFDPKKQISIASSQWGGMMTRTSYRNGVKTVEQIPASKQYDAAYVGDPELTIDDL